jgi:DNA-binding LacI/PurR family transcriptional regulator/DNA-binding transcriptional regulator YhcF (GntR family)
MNTATKSPKIRQILELAERIEADIRHRKLNVGDRYLRTDEVAKMLGVEAGAANRALQLLVQRKRMVRRPGSGTFVAEPEAAESRLALRNVRVLANDRLRALEVMLESGELLGLQRELPGVSIQLDTISVDHEEAQLKEIIAAALKSRNTEGFVLLGSTIAMQRIIGASGLPVVIQGYRRPSVTGMPFVNSDHQQVGKLAVDYLLAQGHKRVVVLARHRSAHQIMDAIRAGLHTAGLPLPAYEQRFLDDDKEEIAAVVHELLEVSDQKTGFVALSRLAGDVVVEVAASRRLRFGRDVNVVLSDFPVTMENLPAYPWIERAVSAAEFGSVVGKLLKQVIQQGGANVPDVVIPVHLRLPEKRIASRER